MTRACRGKFVPVVRWLLSRGDTDPNPIDNNGNSILLYVMENATTTGGNRVRCGRYIGEEMINCHPLILIC
jgi:hypothetical protein